MYNTWRGQRTHLLRQRHHAGLTRRSLGARSWQPRPNKRADPNEKGWMTPTCMHFVEALPPQQDAPLRGKGTCRHVINWRAHSRKYKGPAHGSLKKASGVTQGNHDWMSGSHGIGALQVRNSEGRLRGEEVPLARQLALLFLKKGRVGGVGS